MSRPSTGGLGGGTARAGIDDEVAFETKVAMAKAMVRRATADEIRFAG